ncbi:MAG TPA: DUF438 domain-containing protein [Rectinemataceae bacterium]|nr:DUF438 domain-containing protein [Rectinemataceae bacterium]
MGEYVTIDPERQIRLKKIIGRLHGGAPVSEVKKEFAKLIHGVSAAEVAAMEQSLIDGGMPVEEVQRLCEVHVQVFESSLAAGQKPSGIAGHPIHSMLEENKLAKKKVAALKAAARSWTWGIGSGDTAQKALDDLSAIIIHYARKENQLFPYLEKHDFTGPSRVMWGKHDEIKALFRDAKDALDSKPRAFLFVARTLAMKIQKMIFMEEHILMPEAERRLSRREWAEIRRGEEAIGFAWIRPASLYDAGLALADEVQNQAPAFSPTVAAATPTDGAPTIGAPTAVIADLLDLSTGRVSKEVLDIALKTMPVDISIVDENDRVLYYSDSPHLLFPRSPAAIGRSVQNCHPQKSVDTVNKILTSFKNKERDKARFWIEMGGRFILIEYYALRDGAGGYRGTLEVSQDLTELRALRGQLRLLDWE